MTVGMHRRARAWTRSLLERLLARQGYELKQVGNPVRGYEKFLSYARRRGLRPTTVFDVGVGFGTPWLYRAFPEAAFVLIEPLPLFKPSLENLKRRLNCTVFEVALGEDEGRAQLRVPSGSPTDSSLKPRHTAYENCLRADGVARYDDHVEVDIRVLDSINTFAPPYLLKLDVEGAELEVLKGGMRTLRETDLVLAEVSIMPRHSGEASLAEFLAFMDAQGFCLFDIPSMNQRGSEGALIYIDAAFVRKADPRWFGGKM